MRSTSCCSMRTSSSSSSSSTSTAATPPPSLSLPRRRRRPASACRCATAALTSCSGRSGVTPSVTPGLSRPLRRLPTTIIPIAPTTPTTTPISAFFGVGAPEAILVGVVALLVFGPKGLAEAVKAVGATLRTFQPTIRELASVSSELRSTLEEQIGLDDIKAELNAAVAPLPPPPATKKVVEKTKKEGGEEGEAKAGGDEEGANAEDEDDDDGEREIFDPRPSLSEYAASMGAEKIDPDIEAKRAAAAAAAWGSAGAIPQVLSSSDGSGGDATSSSSSSSSSAPVQGAALEAALAAAAASASPSPPPAAAAPAKSLDGLSIEELEAELARRRGA